MNHQTHTAPLCNHCWNPKGTHNLHWNSLVVTCLLYQFVDYAKKNIPRFMSFSFFLGLHVCPRSCSQGSALLWMWNVLGCCTESICTWEKNMLCVVAIPQYISCMISWSMASTVQSCLGAQKKTTELFLLSWWSVVGFWNRVNLREILSKIDPGNGYFEKQVCWWHLLQNQVFVFEPSRSITERMRAAGDDQQFHNSFPVPCMLCLHLYQTSLP